MPGALDIAADLVKCISRMSKPPSSRTRDRAGAARRRRAAARRGRRGRDHDAARRRGGRREPRPRPLLLRLGGAAARARARALHRAADRAAAADVRGRRARSSRSGGRRWATSSEDATYQKVWLELQALAWNRPELRERLAQVHAEWRAVLTRGVREPPATSSASTCRSRRSSRSSRRSTRGSCSSASAASRTGTRSSSTGSTAGSSERDRRRRPREQTRARYPDEEGYVERDGVRALLRGLRRRASRRSSSADLVDRPLAPLEDADPLPRAALPRADVRRPRQRPLGPARRAPTRTARRSSPPTRSP